MPTEKRQRQKEGRQARLEALRKQQRRRQLVRRGVIALVIAGLVIFSAYKIFGGSSPAAALSPQQKANAAAVAAGCPASPSTRVNTLQWSKPPAMTITTSGTYTAFVQTDLGTFTIALDAKAAPVTVNNFIFLAKHKYFRCVTFHRVIPTFMDQTGDPTGTGSGTPGYSIPDELPKKAKNLANQYPLGSVAMANTGSPHTGGAQFFIVAGPQGEGLPNTYSLFGHVVLGLPVVERINADGSAQGVPPTVIHRILNITITGP